MLSLKSCHELRKEWRWLGVSGVPTTAFCSGLEGGQKHLVNVAQSIPPRPLAVPGKWHSLLS